MPRPRPRPLPLIETAVITCGLCLILLGFPGIEDEAADAVARAGAATVEATTVAIDGYAVVFPKASEWDAMNSQQVIATRLGLYKWLKC
jgi:hypothetical protein